MREETYCCHYMSYYFQLAARDLLISKIFLGYLFEGQFFSGSKLKNASLGIILLIQIIPVLKGRKEEFFLFNGAFNTLYLQLYGIRHMVKDHRDYTNERVKSLLPLHGLFFSISSKGSFICTISQTG